MSGEEVPKWESKPITESVHGLEQSGYPWLVCEMGPVTKEMNVYLTAKHGSINSPQAFHSAVLQQGVWAFDLRMVLDQVRQSGLAEEFDISVQADDGAELYLGAVLTVRPEWDLQDFRAVWKKGDSVIRMTWRENGPVISGRWLVLLPLWRPWEYAIQMHQLSEEERSSFDWRLTDIRPGRYIIRTVHAPWGCEDWRKAQYLNQEIIDTYMGRLTATFESGNDSEKTIEAYFEHLLAHWYRPQQVKKAPTTPLSLTSEQLYHFLEFLEQADALSPLGIPRDNSGSLSIFYMNPQATTHAVASVQEFSNMWNKVLPSREIIFLNPEQQDKAFIREVAFQYTVLGTAEKDVKLRYKRKYLSAPLQEWHRYLHKKKPPPDEVIFLCEKFGLFSDEFSDEISSGDRREYDELKQIYRRTEAV